jgi:SIR2-like domain
LTQALPKRLLEAMRARMLVPFVGAGISKKSLPTKFPNWSEMVSDLSNAAKDTGAISASVNTQILSLIKSGKYLMAVEALKELLPEDLYRSYLQQRFLYTDKEIDLTTQHLLLRIANRIVMTTNFDRLLEDAFAKEYKKAPSAATYREPHTVQATLQNLSIARNPLIFKLHGDIDDVSSIVFSERDYRRIMFDSQGYENVMTTIFLNYVVLFVGFSLVDREILMHIERLRHRMGYFSEPHFALVPQSRTGDVERMRFRKDYGIEIIEYSDKHNHAEIDTVLKTVLRLAR